jgi:RNA polymerase sigma factor (sigma-70 family)
MNELEKEKPGGFKVSVTTQIQHGALAEALQTLKITRRKAADMLKMSVEQFDDLLNLRNIPASFTEHQVAQFYILTGQEIEELFPNFIREQKFVELPKELQYELILSEAELGKGINIYRAPAQPDEILWSLEMQRTIAAALAQLPDDTAEVIRLCVLGEETYEDAGRRLNLSRDQVKHRRSTGLRQIKDSPYGQRLAYLH